ncbi:MAG: hypothetical protein V7672_00805 [Brevundimonas sp.]|uniref:hypothetical protein n=1 Tax=Brevundimonas sp. TaxID=1871086 RepID=UPI003001B5E1
MTYVPFVQIEPCEVLTMPEVKTHKAMIMLGRFGDGWTWATSCHRMTGDMTGYSGPLGHTQGQPPRNMVETRDEALSLAIASIERRIPDAPITDWLSTLLPRSGDQPDLFGEAA